MIDRISETQCQSELSHRETEVRDLVLKGLSNKRIAELLLVTEKNRQRRSRQNLAGTRKNRPSKKYRDALKACP